jgi:MFS family permease
MPNTEAGYWLAVVSGIGAIGTFMGGHLGDKLSDRFDNKRWYFWVPGISTLVVVPFQLVAYLYGEIGAVLGCLMIVSILGGMYLGPSFAMTQGLVTLRMRAVASAILLFILNIIGMGLGPYLVGFASDFLEPIVGSNATSLRYALCLAVLVNVWAAVHYLVGASSVRHDLETTERLSAAPAATRAPQSQSAKNGTRSRIAWFSPLISLAAIVTQQQKDVFMNEEANEVELEDIEELLQEEFNPELFYKALSNALEQLQQIATSEAA